MVPIAVVLGAAAVVAPAEADSSTSIAAWEVRVAPFGRPPVSIGVSSTVATQIPMTGSSWSCIATPPKRQAVDGAAYEVVTVLCTQAGAPGMASTIGRCREGGTPSTGGMSSSNLSLFTTKETGHQIELACITRRP